VLVRCTIRSPSRCRRFKAPYSVKGLIHCSLLSVTLKQQQLESDGSVRDLQQLYSLDIYDYRHYCVVLLRLCM
jgi:hypothetical protein